MRKRASTIALHNLFVPSAEHEAITVQFCIKLCRENLACYIDPSSTTCSHGHESLRRTPLLSNKGRGLSAIDNRFCLGMVIGLDKERASIHHSQISRVDGPDTWYDALRLGWFSESIMAFMLDSPQRDLVVSPNQQIPSSLPGDSQYAHLACNI